MRQYPSSPPTVTRLLKAHIFSENHPLKEGYIFSAGGPIWGMDWCPVPSDKGAGKPFPCDFTSNIELKRQVKPAFNTSP